MTNYEHCKEQIEKYVRLGIEFAVDKNGEIQHCRGLSCNDCIFGNEDIDECDMKKMKWADEEYQEQKVDWSKVPIDTRIFVRINEFSEWKPRHFAGYKDGKVYAWNDGGTSFSATMKISWNCAKIAELVGI